MLTVTPAGGRHAIKNVIFAVEWQAALDSSLIAEISQLHDRFQDKLPRKADQRSVTINIAAGANLPPATPAVPTVPLITGVVFDKVKPNGEPAWAINVNQNMLLALCGEYTRWIPIRDEVFTYFRHILPITLQQHPINAVGLQYTDEFSITGDYNNAPFDCVFNVNTQYVPRNATQLIDLWHSHHGYFERVTAPLAHRHLTNINVNVLGQPDRRLVQIVTSHKCQLDSPTADWAGLIEGDNSLLRIFYESMHTTNKSIITDLLNPQLRRRIGLTTN
jgi:uncharacterized protein (TIGR04255 family)